MSATTHAQYKQFPPANNTTTAQQQSWQGAGHTARAPAPMHNNGKANRVLINQPPQNTVALVNHFDGMHINVTVNANALVVLEASPRNATNERLRIGRGRKATKCSRSVCAANSNFAIAPNTVPSVSRSCLVTHLTASTRHARMPNPTELENSNDYNQYALQIATVERLETQCQT